MLWYSKFYPKQKTGKLLFHSLKRLHPCHQGISFVRWGSDRVRLYIFLGCWSLIRAVPASQQVTIRDNSVCHLVVRAAQGVTHSALPHAKNMMATLSCIESFSRLDNSKQVNLHGTGDSDFPMTEKFEHESADWWGWLYGIQFSIRIIRWTNIRYITLPASRTQSWRNSSVQ